MNNSKKRNLEEYIQRNNLQEQKLIRNKQSRLQNEYPQNIIWQYYDPKQKEFLTYPVKEQPKINKAYNEFNNRKSNTDNYNIECKLLYKLNFDHMEMISESQYTVYKIRQLHLKKALPTLFFQINDDVESIIFDQGQIRSINSAFIDFTSYYNREPEHQFRVLLKHQIHFGDMTYFYEAENNKQKIRKIQFAQYYKKISGKKQYYPQQIQKLMYLGQQRYEQSKGQLRHQFLKLQADENEGLVEFDFEKQTEKVIETQKILKYYQENSSREQEQQERNEEVQKQNQVVKTQQQTLNLKIEEDQKLVKQNMDEVMNLLLESKKQNLQKMEQIQRKKSINFGKCNICQLNINQEIDKLELFGCSHLYHSQCFIEQYGQNFNGKYNLRIKCNYHDCQNYTSLYRFEQIQANIKKQLQEHNQQEYQIFRAIPLCNGDAEQARILIKNGYQNEIQQLEKLTNVQLNSLNYVARVAKIQSEEAYDKLKERIFKMGFNLEDLQVTLKYIRDSAPITINFKLDSIEHFLNDSEGKYRNLFEVGTSGGCNRKEVRAGWEKKLFNGIYDEAQASEKVKYGALNIFQDPSGIKACKMYGTNFFVMKGVRLRSTFYNEDTSRFDDNYLATSQHYNHILMQFNDEELREVMNIASLEGYQFPDLGNGSYKEVQIHGDILFSEHIQSLFYDPDEVSKDEYYYMSLIKRFNKKYGVEFIPINKEDFEEARGEINR